MTRAVLAGLVCAGLILAQTPAPFVPTVSAPELHLAGENLTTISNALFAYATGGQYDREVAAVAKSAHDWVQARTANAKAGGKPAAVFDIDETALSNLPQMLECGFCKYSLQVKLYRGQNLPAIALVLDLYNFAKSKEVAVIMLTGRTESERPATVANLRTVGYTGYQELLMRPDGNKDTAAAWKAGIRAKIEQEGYRIILNIGDQLSDLTGGHSERTYKLPDPFYFVK